MKRLGIFFLSGFFILVISVFAEAQTRSVATYEGGYLVGEDHSVSETEKPCPENTHTCVHTYRKYGPEGSVNVRTTKHCVPNQHSQYENVYGHSSTGPESYYEDVVYEPPVRVYQPRYYVYQPPVVVRPQVVYQDPYPYYDYYDGYYPSYGLEDTLVGGAFGAAAGAAIGAIVGSPGKGAAIGAVVGGLNLLGHGLFGYGYHR